MIYKDHEIKSIYINVEAFDINDSGSDLKLRATDKSFAGYAVAEKDETFSLQNVDINQDEEYKTFYVDGGFSELSEAKNYIDELEPTTPEIKAELEQLRQALRDENISQGELIRLAELADYIEFGDVELLEPAGVPEGVNN